MLLLALFPSLFHILTLSLPQIRYLLVNFCILLRHSLLLLSFNCLVYALFRSYLTSFHLLMLVILKKISVKNITLILPLFQGWCCAFIYIVDVVRLCLYNLTWNRINGQARNFILGCFVQNDFWDLLLLKNSLNYS